MTKPGRRFVACGATVRSPPGNRQEQIQRDSGPLVCAGCHRISVATSATETRCHFRPENPDSRKKVSLTPRRFPRVSPFAPGIGRNHHLNRRCHWWPRVASLGASYPLGHLRESTPRGPTWATVVGVLIDAQMRFGGLLSSFTPPRIDRQKQAKIRREGG